MNVTSWAAHYSSAPAYPFQEHFTELYLLGKICWTPYKPTIETTTIELVLLFKTKRHITLLARATALQATNRRLTANNIKRPPFKIFCKNNGKTKKDQFGPFWTYFWGIWTTHGPFFTRKDMLLPFALSGWGVLHG